MEAHTSLVRTIDRLADVAPELDGVRVVGCTWGGSAILLRMVAAPGMCIEFDNGVRTTRAREVRVLRGDQHLVH